MKDDAVIQKKTVFWYLYSWISMVLEFTNLKWKIKIGWFWFSSFFLLNFKFKFRVFSHIIQNAWNLDKRLGYRTPRKEQVSSSFPELEGGFKGYTYILISDHCWNKCICYATRRNFYMNVSGCLSPIGLMIIIKNEKWISNWPNGLWSSSSLFNSSGFSLWLACGLASKADDPQRWKVIYTLVIV